MRERQTLSLSDSFSEKKLRETEGACCKVFLGVSRPLALFILRYCDGAVMAASQ
jgi:hypothetical protein